jgi:S1-C subfamily serine protease
MNIGTMLLFDMALVRNSRPHRGSVEASFAKRTNRRQPATRSSVIRGLMLIGLGLLILTPTSDCADNSFTGWAPIVSKNKNLTVLIRVEVPGKPPGYGSGVIVRPGHVLTAKHILPESSIRQAGDFLIAGLVGWDDPSIDFSHAQRLEVEYVSDRYDLAILRYRTALPTKRYAFSGSDPHLGDPLLVMGYPDGGSLTCTAGLASRKAEDGKFATDAAVGVGNSGGPIFTTTGGLVGILLEGSRRDSDGKIALGYFLTADAIRRELSSVRADVRLTSTPPLAESIPLIQTITFAYSVDDEKTDHPALIPTEKSVERSFRPLDGFRFASARFQKTSANHVSKEPEVIISDDGMKAVLRYSLQSGPLFDQWRGWIVGSLITTQERK